VSIFSCIFASLETLATSSLTRQSQYNTLVCRVDEVSDVPGNFFFIISYRLRALKTLYFYFCKVIKNHKNKLKGFLQRILQEIMKKILGPSDAWSKSRLSHRPRDPAYYFEGCKIFENLKGIWVRSGVQPINIIDNTI
jgi:hypothetical protein